MRPRMKHCILVGSAGKKEQFALYLTEKFEPTLEETVSEEEVSEEETVSTEDDEVKSAALILQGDAMIIGRVRKRNGKACKGFDVALLDDDLQELSNVTTDESGVFRIDGVDPKNMNLVRMSADDDKIQVDMFLYDKDANIIGKPVSLGHRLHSFKAGSSSPMSQFNVLTEQDLVVMVSVANPLCRERSLIRPLIS